MARRLLSVCSFAWLLAASTAAPAAVTSFTPNPANLDNLDHHVVYAWGINNVDPSGATITGATISIKNIANWDSSPNILYIHLLDAAKSAGVTSFVHDPNETSDVPPSQWVDDFVNPRFHNNPTWLIAPGTADTFLASPSFTDQPANYTYTFTSAQLQALNAYVHNGDNIALGFDPNCHFFNDGVTFTITTSPIPEPSAVVLLGIGLGGFLLHRRVLGRKPKAVQAV